MASRGALVYALSAVSIIISLLILLNDLALLGEIGEAALARDLALVALGLAVGAAAPILYKKFSQ